MLYNNSLKYTKGGHSSGVQQFEEKYWRAHVQYCTGLFTWFNSLH